MNRVIGVMASLILMISLSLGSISAQEPARTTAPSQTKGAPGGTTAAPAPAQAKAGEATKTKKDAPKTATDEEPVVTHHKVLLERKELPYTATAGLMPIRDAKGDVEARIFYIAYTRDDAGAVESRPLLFSFNGGPGSASVWLHLGALGPRRVATPEKPTIPAPPFRLVNNDATWLDRADLVFIDPVGTGYSRAAKPELNSKFHSLRGDIESVGEFIRMYLTRNDRWSSPLYLIGESYGTTRAAGLAGYLVDLGIAFNGVVLVSCALDFQGFVFSPGNDLPYLTYLPSYTAAAWYHKKLPADLQASGLVAVLKEVQRWTDREYVSILARGDRLSDEERREAAARLARYTSLNAAEIEADHLRIRMSHFCRNLLKPARRSVGRFDARYQGIESLGFLLRRAQLRPQPGRRPCPVHRHVQPVHPYRARLQERPPLLHPRRGGRPLGLAARDGLSGDDQRPPRCHGQEPSHEGPDRLRLLRPRHAVPRRRARPGRPGTRPEPAPEYHGGNLRSRAHDVPG